MAENSGSWGASGTEYRWTGWRVQREGRDSLRSFEMTAYRNLAAYSRRSFATFGATTAWQCIRVGFRWKYCWWYYSAG
jgi:hypothetical protein